MIIACAIGWTPRSRGRKRRRSEQRAAGRMETGKGTTAMTSGAAARRSYARQEAEEERSRIIAVQCVGGPRYSGLSNVSSSAEVEN